jgi:probable rRNA maturation factor
MRSALRQAATTLSIPKASELSLLLTDDARIRDLNREYRGKDEATDVLSFPQDDPELLILGDVAISIETAVRQAGTAGWSLESELSLLAVHGILHLMGLDDETESGAIAMEMRTREILSDASIELPSGEHPFLQRADEASPTDIN